MLVVGMILPFSVVALVLMVAVVSPPAGRLKLKVSIETPALETPSLPN